MARHGGHCRSRPAARSVQSGNGLSAGHLRQPCGLLRGVAKQRHGATTQALHGKGKVSQAVVKRQRLAQQAQVARVNAVGGPPKACPATAWRSQFGLPNSSTKARQRASRAACPRAHRAAGLPPPRRQVQPCCTVRGIKPRQRHAGLGHGADDGGVAHVSRPQILAFAWPQTHDRPGESRWSSCTRSAPAPRPQWSVHAHVPLLMEHFWSHRWQTWPGHQPLRPLHGVVL